MKIEYTCVKFEDGSIWDSLHNGFRDYEKFYGKDKVMDKNVQ